MCGGVLISSFLDILEVGAGFEGVQDWAAEQSSVSGGGVASSAWGGRLTWTTVTSRLQVFLIYAPQATVTYLRVWYSVHFGYYFYASRGDILVVKFSGS